MLAGETGKLCQPVNFLSAVFSRLYDFVEHCFAAKYRLAPREGLFREDKDLAAAYRRLLRAGFRSGEIIRVLKRFARNPDLLDAFEPPEEEEKEV